jgi:UDP-glucose 4-epimerase
MNILVTGGAGYIGYSVVRRLLDDAAAPHSITIYDNLARKNYSFFTEARFDHKPIRFLHDDILNGRALLKALDGIDCVIHLAAKVTSPNDDSEAHIFDQINHWGTAQLSIALETSDVQRVVNLGSTSVYGHGDSCFEETLEPRPFSFYGISKLAGERQLAPIANKMELYTLRSANVYGYNPAYRTDAVINRFMFDANFHRKIQIHGSGDQRRSFIHVDTLADYVVGAVNHKFEPGLYNVAEFESSMNEVASKIAELYPGLETVHIDHRLRLNDTRVKLPGRIADLYDAKGPAFSEALSDFKSQFSF